MVSVGVFAAICGSHKRGICEAMIRSAKHKAATTTTTDINTQGWVRYLPRPARACALLSRWDRPVGVWLLLWPALWGLLVAHSGQPSWHLVAVFVFGAVLMRGAGCTINDILDRNLDASVARTAARPLPAGLISVPGAWIWFVVQLVLAAALLLLLPRAVVAWAAVAIPLVMLYPLMKRITWWPQAWLGLTFNWGLWLGIATVGMPDAVMLWAALGFYVGAFFWTLGYDTIYATQDMDDDALIGVRSTARLFGTHANFAVAVCYALALGCWLLSAYYLGLAHVAYGVLGIAAGLMLWQFKLWATKPFGSRLAFKNNIWVGAAVALALLLGYAF